MIYFFGMWVAALPPPSNSVKLVIAFFLLLVMEEDGDLLVGNVAVFNCPTPPSAIVPVLLPSIQLP